MNDDNTYGISQILGSSKTSIDDAIRQAVSKAGENRRKMRWFEVNKISGHIVDGEVGHFQVEIKIGYTLDD